MKRILPSMDPWFEDVGREFRRCRQNRGMTQRQLTTRTGIAQADISKLENGRANASLRSLDRIARGMGCRLVVTIADR